MLPPGAELLEGEYMLRSEGGPSGPIMVLSVRECVARFRGLEPPAQPRGSRRGRRPADRAGTRGRNSWTYLMGTLRGRYWAVRIRMVNNKAGH
jgi:hypothetical protein